MAGTSTQRQPQTRSERWRSRQSTQLQGMSEMALGVLRRYTPVRLREPTTSGEDIRAQGHRTRSVLNATIADQFKGGT
jgi:hypothetical protein